MQLTDGENLHHAVLYAPIGICILDADTLVTELVNDKFLEVAGKPFEAVFGKFYWDAFAEARSAYETALARVVKTGVDYHANEVELMLIRHGREEMIFVTFVYAAIKNKAGKVSKIAIWVLENTTQVAEREKKEVARVAFQQERDRLKSFFMQAPAGICILGGKELSFELVNPLYQQLFPGRDLLGKPLLDAVPEIRDQPIWEILQAVYQTGETFEGNSLLIPLARTDGGPIEDRYFNFIYTARTGLHDEIDGILVFVFEVTEILAGQNELQKAQDILNLAIEASELGIWRADFATDQLYITDQTRTIHGVPKGQELTLTESSAMIRAEFREKVMNGIAYAVEHKQDFCEEYWIDPMDGSKSRWLRSNGKAYYNENGEPLYISGTIADLTEQKEDDIRKSDFIGMVSHELKTPLTSLTSYLQVLQSKATQSSDSFTRGALDQSVKQVKKMTTMINSFLNISRLESGKIHIDRQTFDMASLVKETEAETVVMNNSHTFIFHPVERTIVNADRDKIGQVISNFISNAVKYSKPGSTIQIACVSEGNEARFSVSDEGMGISPEDTGRLFERYYRVKNNSSISGFGIGLYLCSEIVMRHEGKIWVESEPGKGSIFYFSLMLEK